MNNKSTVVRGGDAANYCYDSCIPKRQDGPIEAMCQGYSGHLKADQVVIDEGHLVFSYQPNPQLDGTCTSNRAERRLLRGRASRWARTAPHIAPRTAPHTVPHTAPCESSAASSCGQPTYRGQIATASAPFALSQRLRPGRETGQPCFDAKKRWCTESEGRCPWANSLGREFTSVIDKLRLFDGFAKSLHGPHLHLFRICSVLRVPVFVTANSHSFTGALADEICAGILANGMNQIALCNTGRHHSWRTEYLSYPPTRRCSSAPAPPHETLTESERRRPGQGPWARNASAIDQTVCFRWVGEETRRLSTYVCSRFGRVNTQHELLAFEC